MGTVTLVELVWLHLPPAAYQCALKAHIKIIFRPDSAVGERVLSFTSNVRCVTLKISRRSLHKFFSFDNISIIPFFNALSSTSKRYTIGCQYCCNAALFSRLPTGRSCCLEARPYLVSTDRDRVDSWLVGVKIVIISFGAGRLWSLTLLCGCRMGTAMARFTIIFRDPHIPATMSQVMVRWMIGLPII